MRKAVLAVLSIALVFVAVLAVRRFVGRQSGSGNGADAPEAGSRSPEHAAPLSKSDLDGDNPVSNLSAASKGSEPPSADSLPFMPNGQGAGGQGPDHLGKRDLSPMAAAQVRSVAEALRSKQHPERLSMMIESKPFDQAAFDADPDSYLRVIIPGRVFQCAQPGAGVAALRSTGPRQHRIEPGGSVKLEVKGAQRAPVTFTSSDMGAFAENKLNSITVRADENGLASVTFVATPGADGDVNILAGSPLASGQARFVVMVENSPLRRPAEDGDEGQARTEK
jgi:hypothetical protein